MKIIQTKLKRGFRGAGSYWADHLGYTDIDNKADFGETEYGDNTKRKRRLLKRLLICGIMIKDRNTPKS